MRTSSSLGALFPKTRQAVLAATLLHPERRWYMRELAKHLKLSPSSLQRELESLAGAGVLRRSAEGKHVYFQAETGSPLYPDLRNLMLKTVGLVDVLRAALIPLAERIASAFVYGSVARGEEYGGSDIDVMIIGDVGLAEVSQALCASEQKLGRPINPTIYPPKELRLRVNSKNHFVMAALASEKIFIHGDQSELERITGRKTHSAA